MTRLSKIIPLVAGASLFFTAAAWAETAVSGLDRFRLFNNCRSLDLVIEDLNKDAPRIGLKKKEITIAVRSRLRAARLYSKGQLAYLYVNVTVTNLAFGIKVEYKKWLGDAVSGERGGATTWDAGSIGTHGQDSGYILSSVSRHTDEFIDEYLRVNESACES